MRGEIKGSSPAIRSHKVRDFLKLLGLGFKKDTHHNSTKIYSSWKIAKSVIMLDFCRQGQAASRRSLMHSDSGIFSLRILNISSVIYLKQHTQNVMTLCSLQCSKGGESVTCLYEALQTCTSSAGMYNHLRLNLPLRHSKYCQSSDRPESIWSLITSRV